MAFGFMNNLGGVNATSTSTTPTPAPTIPAPASPGFGGPLGTIFSRMGGKNAPKPLPGVAASGPGIDAYKTLPQGDRGALLQAMLMRARGGQAGGAPTTPLPAPNSNIPVA